MTKDDNIIIGTLGAKGSGKSLFTKRHLIPRFKRIIILDSLGEYDHMVTNDIESFYEALKANINKEYFVICYRPIDKNPEAFFKIAEACFDVTVVVEEADFYCSPYNMLEEFSNLVRYGRHFKQNLLWISRRPAEVSRQITAQSDVIISFRQAEPIDIDYFKKVSQQALRLPELKEFEYPERMVEDTHYIILKGKKFLQKI